MESAYLFLGLAALLFGATAIAAFLWAYRSGQFSNLDEAAKSIFEADEELGGVSGEGKDHFPTKRNNARWRK